MKLSGLDNSRVEIDATHRIMFKRKYEHYLKGEKTASQPIITVYAGNIPRLMINLEWRMVLTLFASLVIGPAFFFLGAWTNPDFALGEELLVLFALFVMGFESVWIVYALGVLINKAANNRIDNFRFE